MNTQNQKIYLETIIPEHLAGSRLDFALAQLFPQYSRSRIQEWIKQNQVLVNNLPYRAKDKVYGNESIQINAQTEIETPWQGQAIALDIIYEDEALIVINKPPGMVVHPAAGNPENTLVNALLHHEPKLAQLPRAGIIHRLDKDTSGLLVVPKTLTAHTHLVIQLQKHTMKREYEAIVSGTLISGATVDAPIDRHPIHRKRMGVREDGKKAITHFRVIERFAAYTHVKVMLETGRTHQIRVHMSHIKHPLLGDSLYGFRLTLPPKASPELIQALQGFKRQALHAKQLGFVHPLTQESMQWEVEIPQDMQHVLTLLRAHNAQSHLS